MLISPSVGARALLLGRHSGLQGPRPRWGLVFLPCTQRCTGLSDAEPSGRVKSLCQESCSDGPLISPSPSLAPACLRLLGSRATMPKAEGQAIVNGRSSAELRWPTGLIPSRSIACSRPSRSSHQQGAVEDFAQRDRRRPVPLGTAAGTYSASQVHRRGRGDALSHQSGPLSGRKRIESEGPGQKGHQDGRGEKCTAKMRPT